MDWISERDLAVPARVRLFCLPHAGSGAAGFYRWKRLLPATIAVCPVLLPGREGRLREPAITDARQIVSALHAAVSVRLDEPYAIFGHSMGALLAYEWGRLIQHDGLQPPSRLFVSGRNAPQLGCAHHGLHSLPDADLVRELGARYGGNPGALLEDIEMRDLFLPILRADLAAVESYASGPIEPLECPVLAFAGSHDHSVSDTGLAAWAETTRGPFAARRLPGDHFSHLGEAQSPLLEAIAAELAPNSAVSAQTI